MANFFKSKRGKLKPVSAVAERPRFFKQLRDLKTEEAIARLSGKVFHDKIFWVFFGIWIVPIVGTLIYSLLNFNSLPYEIPLFYSRAWGEAQLAESKYVFLPIFGVIILGILNFVFAAVFHPKDKVFSYLLMGVSSLISILAAITTFNIINLMS